MEISKSHLGHAEKKEKKKMSKKKKNSWSSGTLPLDAVILHPTSCVTVPERMDRFVDMPAPFGTLHISSTSPQRLRDTAS